MTAVNVYEGQLMINVDLSTKVMNKQTVYSILTDKFNRINDPKQAQDASLKELVGQIVLTPFVLHNFYLRTFTLLISLDTTMKHTKLWILSGIKIQHINSPNVMVQHKHLLNIIKKYEQRSKEFSKICFFRLL